MRQALSVVNLIQRGNTDPLTSLKPICISRHGDLTF